MHALRFDRLLIDTELHRGAGDHHVMRLSQCRSELRVSHFNGCFITMVSELMLAAQERIWVHSAGGGNADT